MCVTDLLYNFLYKIPIYFLVNFTFRFKPFSLTRSGFLCYIYNVHGYLERIAPCCAEIRELKSTDNRKDVNLNMKKCISLLLCLAMLVSVFSVLSVTASAASAGNVMYVKSSSFINNLVTYTIYLKKNVSVWGSIINVKYDPKVLEPVSAGAYQVKDSYGDTVDNVPGMYDGGKVAGKNNLYTIAFLRIDNYYTGSSDKAFINVTFRAIDKNYPKTKVDFYCVEYNGADEKLNIPKNETNPQLLFSHTISTLDKVRISSIFSVDVGLRINWYPVDGAKKYLIFKKTETGYECLGTTGPTATYFDDTKARPNTVEYYLVRAYNGNYDSGIVEFVYSGVYIKAPDKVAAAIQADSVKLSWTKVVGATGYKLFRREILSNGARGVWVELSSASATTTAFVDKTVVSGKHYEYTVRTIAPRGASAVCKFAQIYYYKAPTVNLASATGGVNITWDSIPGAETYRIYRRYVDVGTWICIAIVDKNTLSYLDKDANTSKIIDYTVRAFSDNGSSTFVAKRYASAVATPVLTGVSNVVNGVYVRWNAVSGATGYRVYRRGAGQTTWTYLGTVKTTYFTDTKATSGAYWRYTVVAESGNALSAFDTNGLYLKHVATPKMKSVANRTEGINISWSSVGGATGYRIYRRSAGQTTWTYLGTVTSTSYTDKNVVKNTYYRYTVRAVSGNVYSYFESGLLIKR